MIFTNNFIVTPPFIGIGQQNFQMFVHGEADNNIDSTLVQITHHLPNQMNVVWIPPSEGTINQNGKELINIVSFTEEDQTFTFFATIDKGEGGENGLPISLVAIDLTDKSQDVHTFNVVIQ